MRFPFESLRNPAHTGERRCLPCTVVNAAILLLVVTGLARRRSRSLAAGVGVGGLVAIALRGYLVPYTPRFAPQLVSWLPGDPFHTGDSHRADGIDPDVSDTPDEPGSLGGDTDAETGEAVLAALVESGVVVGDDETLYLADEFREAWRDEVRILRDRDDEGLAAALESAAPEGLVVDVVETGNRWFDDNRWFVVSDGSDDPAREQWLSRPVAIAETAAVRTLADRTDLSSERRAQAAGPLRTFLESCPVCDGRVVETTSVDCCGGPGGTRPDAPDEVLACEDCDARLYTFQ